MPVIANFNIDSKRLTLPDDKLMTIVVDGIDYYVYYLDLAQSGNKGAHSNIFRLYLAQDFVNIEESQPQKVIKISNTFDTYSNGEYIVNSANKRFFREIQVLKDCTQRNMKNIIHLDVSDYLLCSIEHKDRHGVIKKRNRYYPFYIMDYADCDLKHFFEENTDIGYEERINLCLQLANGLKELYDLGYYHRDLKPDNILMFDGQWKIGDLGLISSRDEDSDLDKKGGWIGPRGWMSPESMNKFLTEDIEGLNFDCKIDHQSDIFQLGKIFWFIFQGNAPIGCVKRADFLYSDERIYQLIRTMLNHSKLKRPKDIGSIIKDLECIIDYGYQGTLKYN